MGKGLGKGSGERDRGRERMNVSHAPKTLQYVFFSNAMQQITTTRSVAYSRETRLDVECQGNISFQTQYNVYYLACDGSFFFCRKKICKKKPLATSKKLGEKQHADPHLYFLNSDIFSLGISDVGVPTRRLVG